jgi:hypothetical protein
LTTVLPPISAERLKMAGFYDWSFQDAWAPGAWSPGAYDAGAFAPGAWHRPFGLPETPNNAFTYLLGTDGGYLFGADGAFLYGSLP